MVAFTEQQRAFLDQPLSAVVATLRRDGTASQSVVWFVREGDELWMSVAPDSLKARHLRRDPRISVLVLSANGWQFLEVEGTATSDERVTPELRLQLIGKYVGADHAPAWVAEHPLPQLNTLARIRPERVVEHLG